MKITMMRLDTHVLHTCHADSPKVMVSATHGTHMKLDSIFVGGSDGVDGAGMDDVCIYVFIHMCHIHTIIVAMV